MVRQHGCECSQCSSSSLHLVNICEPAGDEELFLPRNGACEDRVYDAYGSAIPQMREPKN